MAVEVILPDGTVDSYREESDSYEEWKDGALQIHSAVKGHYYAVGDWADVSGQKHVKKKNWGVIKTDPEGM